MKGLTGTLQVPCDDDLSELAHDLLLGHAGESEGERAARHDAAVDLLANDPYLAARTDRLVDHIAEQLVAALTAPSHASRRPRTRTRRRVRQGVAA
jgi:hypothetical protein